MLSMLSCEYKTSSNYKVKNIKIVFAFFSVIQQGSGEQRGWINGMDAC